MIMKYIPILMSSDVDDEIWFETEEKAWEYVYSMSCKACKENPEFDSCSAEWDVWTREEWDYYCGNNEK